ncbi:MAG: ferritin family protein [Bacteroidota bacterium]
MFNTAHLHPLMVHFPVALIITGFFFDVISLFFSKKEPALSKAGFYLMILGTLGAVAGYLSGEFFTKEYTGVLGELKENHELFAKITMFVMIAASLIRIFLVWKKKENSGLKWLVFLLFFVAVGTVGYTGLLGGNMVYDNMIGMQDVVASGQDSTKADTPTVANLKAALQGETTASAKYAAFAAKAREEGFTQIGVLFDATSKSESIHAANHAKVLETMGIHMSAIVAQPFEVKTTKENLEAAYAGEKHEVEAMYQGFIDQAKAETNDDAVKSFSFAMETEKKHMELYKTTIDALAANKVKTLPTEYFVCPKCGFTYSNKDEEDECEICSTPKEKFFSFK